MKYRSPGRSSAAECRSFMKRNLINFVSGSEVNIDEMVTATANALWFTDMEQLTKIAISVAAKNTYTRIS